MPPNLAASIELIRYGWLAGMSTINIIPKIDYKCRQIKIDASVEYKIKLMSKLDLWQLSANVPVIKRPITHQSTKGAKQKSYCNGKKKYKI